MKNNCEACDLPLKPNDAAHVCSFDCTFCPVCTENMQSVCPNCGGELKLRPRRKTSEGWSNQISQSDNFAKRWWMVWAVSFAVWTLVAFAGTLSIYKLYRSTESPMRFFTTMGWEFSQILTYAPLTPFVFAFATKFPIRRDNWAKRAALYLSAGLAFAVAHIALRGVTPFAYWDSKSHEFNSAVWDSHLHVFKVQWLVMQKQFFAGVVDDVTGTFVLVVLVAHAISYYRRFRERELRAAQLEGQLAKAHLQTLKSQLQPHFLFNTLHSISCLMLSDVKAADKMMARLGDLLRMSLESAGTQITTLNRELEFVNCYLEIEKMRFAERLNVGLEIDPETLDALVPHLLLQPLVDNAIKHGISKMPHGGQISIKVSGHDGELDLEILDNGPGFHDVKSAMTGLGLRITRERLESLYGKNQNLEHQNLAGGGAVVRISIPFRLKQAEGRSSMKLRTAS